MSVNQPMGQHDDDLPKIQIWLMRALEWIQKNLTFVVAIGLIVGVGYGALTYYQSTVYQQAATAWSKFGKAQSAADFGEVAKESGSAEIGIWARLAEAESELRDGVRLQFTDRKSADSELKKAAEAFDAVIKSGNAPSSALERAYLGKARFLEATSDGAVDQALEAYEAIAKKYPDSIYKQLVEGRIAALKASGSKDFYAWFSKQNPKPEDRPKPRDGMPPGHPSIDSQNITLPPIPDELYPANWSELQASAEDDKPSTGDQKTEEKPAAVKKPEVPASDSVKPEATEKPASDKPASDKTEKPETGKTDELKPDASAK